MKKILILTAAALFVNMASVMAWGNKGHKITAQLAKNFLNKNVIDSVQYYLGTTSFEEASVWMDEVRSDHAYDYLKPMHYVNIEKDKTYVKTSDPNVINELDVVITALQDRKSSTKEEIKKNLMILFHLTGDLHQPLHAGYSGDKGGNSVSVDFMGFSTNLHRVWDTNIIEEQKITAESCMTYINTLSAKEKSGIMNSTVMDWVSDSRELLKPVYTFGNSTIDKQYIAVNTPVVEKQLSKAGLRLAATLNKIFSGNRTETSKQ